MLEPSAICHDIHIHQHVSQYSSTVLMHQKEEHLTNTLRH